MDHGEAGAIGAETEIGRLAEGERTGIAEQQVERHGGKAQDQNPGSQRGIAAEERQPIGGGQQDEPEGDRAEMAPHS